MAEILGRTQPNSYDFSYVSYGPVPRNRRAIASPARGTRKGASAGKHWLRKKSLFEI